MSQYNSVTMKLLDSQLEKLKSARKNKTEVTLRLPLIMFGTSETIIPIYCC